MTSKVLPLQKFQVVVRQPNKVENWLAIIPVQSRWVDVAVHKTVVVHVRNCACDLPENQQKSWRGKVCLAELLPQADMLRTVCLEKESVSLGNLGVRLLEVEDVRVRRQVRKLLCKLIGKELLFVEKGRDVNNGEEAETAGLRVILKGDFSVALLRVNDVDQELWLLVPLHDELGQRCHIRRLAWPYLRRLRRALLLQNARVLLNVVLERAGKVVGEAVVRWVP